MAHHIQMARVGILSKVVQKIAGVIISSTSSATVTKVFFIWNTNLKQAACSKSALNLVVLEAHLLFSREEDNPHKKLLSSI